MDMPTIGLLTNVCWDAQLHYPANVFKDMIEWILVTIDYFSRRHDLQLIIRVHPAEVTASMPSRQRVMDEIKKYYPVLPNNIFLVAPENPLNTYSLMGQCNAVLIYGTKTGVELTSFGIPVIVAGEAWIRNKGITMDADTQEGYFEILDQLPLNSRMRAPEIERARKYAYHFFFRRMIPIEVLRPTDGWPPFQIALQKLSDLYPGAHRGLDVVCDGILKAMDFIYPDEKFRFTAQQ